MHTAINSRIIATLALIFTLGYFLGHHHLLSSSSDNEKSTSDIPAEHYNRYDDKSHIHLFQDHETPTTTKTLTSNTPAATDATTATSQASQTSLVIGDGEYYRLLAEVLRAVIQLNTNTPSTRANDDSPQNHQQLESNHRDNGKHDLQKQIKIHTSLPLPFHQQLQHENVPVDAIVIAAHITQRSHRTDEINNTAAAAYDRSKTERCSEQLGPVCCKLEESLHAVVNYCVCVSTGGSFVAPGSSCASLSVAAA